MHIRMSGSGTGRRSCGAILCGIGCMLFPSSSGPPLGSPSSPRSSPTRFFLTPFAVRTLAAAAAGAAAAAETRRDAAPGQLAAVVAPAPEEFAAACDELAADALAAAAAEARHDAALEQLAADVALAALNATATALALAAPPVAAKPEPDASAADKHAATSASKPATAKHCTASAGRDVLTCHDRHEAKLLRVYHVRSRLRSTCRPPPKMIFPAHGRAAVVLIDIILGNR